MFLKIWKDFEFCDLRNIEFCDLKNIKFCDFRNKYKFWHFYLQFECPYCHRVMKTRQNLQRHIRTHTGEKPFQCPFCEYGSSQKNNCERHILKVHATAFNFK